MENFLKILFRFDDFTLDDSHFNKLLINTFEKNNIPLCLGVIPFDKNEKFINLLSEKSLSNIKNNITTGLLDIALHGYIHKNNRNDNYSKSEFNGVPFSDQLEWITEGKQRIEDYLDCKIETFIPPWNSYDENTLRVLEKNSFKCISAGFNLKCGPMLNNNIKYIPATFENFDNIEKLINHNKNRDVYLILLFHEYSLQMYENDNYENKITFKQLDNILKKIKLEKQISCNTFSDLVNSSEKFDKEIFHRNQKRNLVKDMLKLNKVYTSDSYTSKLEIINVAVHSFLVIFSFISTFILLLTIDFPIINYLLIILLSGLLVYFTKFNFSTPKRKVFFLLSLSVIVASVLNIFQSSF